MNKEGHAKEQGKEGQGMNPMCRFGLCLCPRVPSQEPQNHCFVVQNRRPGKHPKDNPLSVRGQDQTYFFATIHSHLFARTDGADRGHFCFSARSIAVRTPFFVVSRHVDRSFYFRI